MRRTLSNSSRPVRYINRPNQKKKGGCNNAQSAALVMIIWLWGKVRRFIPRLRFFFFFFFGGGVGGDQVAHANSIF